MVGVLIVTVIAFGLSVLIVLINFYLNKVDHEVEAVLAFLPGYNCGVCGFGGCAEMTFQIVKNNIDPKKCKSLSEDQYQRIINYLKKRNELKVSKDNKKTQG